MDHIPWATRSLLTVCLFAILTSTVVVCEKTYLSRPDLTTPTWEITVRDEDKISPGYWFVSPWLGASQPAPYIYDGDGELIWSGFNRATGAHLTSWDFRLIEINGSTALSFFRGAQDGPFGSGKGYIMDSSYTIQKEVTTGTGRRYVLDGHEFRVINNGRSALVSIYEPKQADLSSLGLGIGLGWIWECIFQELDLESGAVLFEWRSHDHVPITHTEAVPDLNLGVGTAFSKAFDYFHLNSIDKNSDGDYLISARYMSAIYKISGSTGSILWQLGGANSSFELVGFNFSGQHHAQYQDSHDGDEVITLFNNADNGRNSTRNYSSGLMISLRTTSSPMTARPISEWVMPSPHQRSKSQGSLQTLPNGNVFVGRGYTGQLSEFTANGTWVLTAKFEGRALVNSYRAYKFPAFIGTPRTLPDVYTYSLTNHHPVSFYVSWNGATEVAAWCFYGGFSAAEKDLTLLGRVNRAGFETTFKAKEYFPFGYAAAIAANGSVISRSLIQETAVAPPNLTASCRVDDCFIWPGDWKLKASSILKNGSTHNNGSTDKDENLQVYFQITRGLAMVYLLFSCGFGFLLARASTVLPRLVRKKRGRGSNASPEKSMGSTEDSEALLSGHTPVSGPPWIRTSCEGNRN